MITYSRTNLLRWGWFRVICIAPMPFTCQPRPARKVPPMKRRPPSVLSIVNYFSLTPSIRRDGDPAASRQCAAKLAKLPLVI